MASTTYTWNGFETTLAATMGVGAQSVQLTTTTGLQAPCYLLLDADIPASREWVRVNSINGTTIENVVRNQAGSVGDIEHAAGAKVRCVFSHQQLAAIFGDISTVESNVSSISSALSSHTSGSDQHPEYLKSASHTKALHDALNINAGTLDGIDSTGFSLSSHSHSVYATTSHLHTGTYAPDSHLHTGVYAPNSHVGSGGSAHASATTSVAGFMSASDKTILNNLNAGSGNQTITAGVDLTGGGSTSTINIDHENVQSTAASITGLTGAAVISGVGLNGRGHVNVLTQRNLTAANIGAATTSHVHTGTYSDIDHGHNVDLTMAFAAVGFNNNSGALTGLYLNGEEVDGLNGHSTTSERQRITVPEAGYYLCIAQVAFDAAAGGVRMIQISENGTSNIRAMNRVPSAGASEGTIVSCQAVILVTSGYVEAHSYQDSGGIVGTVSGSGLTFFHVMKLTNITT